MKLTKEHFEKFTHTQLAILSKLSDGLPHSKESICDYIGHEETPTNRLTDRISKLRKSLRVDGHEIVCVFKERKTFYQHVILLPAAQDYYKGIS